MRYGAHRRRVAAVIAATMVVGLVVAHAGPAAAATATSIGPSWITTSAREERVKALAKIGNTLYVGGEFKAIAPAPNTPTIAQPYLFAIDATTGVQLPAFAPVITAPAGTELKPSGVLALTTDPSTNTLYVGGTFTSVNGEALAGFAVLDATTGALKPGVAQRSLKRGNNLSGVYALLRVGAKLYAGGNFDKAGTVDRQNLARFDIAGGAVSLDAWAATTDGPVLSLALDPTMPDRVYAGGEFIAAGPASDPRAKFLAAFETATPNTLLNWFPQPDGGDKPAWVMGLDAAAGRVYAGIAGGGGQFVVYDGNVGAKKIVVKQMRANGNQQAVKVVGNLVYVGGHHDNWTNPVIDRQKFMAFRIDTLEPVLVPDVRVSGVWGVFAIYGEDDPNDVWVGGMIASLTEPGRSINTGNLWHLSTSELDEVAPSAPAGVAVSNGPFSSIRVAWGAASDNRFVSAYYVYANGTLKAVVSGRSTAAAVNGLASATAYQITVRALDGNRNLGPPSAPASITTGAAPPSLPNPLKGFGQFYAVNPQRVLDTRVGLGAPAAPVVGGQPLAVTVTGLGEVPATGVSMVALNVTVTGPSQAGFLSVYPAGGAVPATSNLNFTAGQTVPNFVVARVSATGAVNVLVSSGATHVLVDVVGWFGTAATPAPGSKLVLQQPARVLDTRATGAVGPATVDVQVAPAGSTVDGVVINLTGVGPTRGTYVSVYPADQASPPNVSSLNLVPGQTRPNLVMVRVPRTGPQAGKIRLFNASGSTHLLVDVLATFTKQAAFDNNAAGRLLPLDAPLRIVDTRGQGGPLGGPAQTTWDLRFIDDATPAKVSGLVLNATATGATAPTYLTLFPAGTAQPNASNLNIVPGESVPNAAVVGLSAAEGLSVFNAAGSVHHILDVSALVLGS